MNYSAEQLKKANPQCNPDKGPECPYCKSLAVLKHGSFIYPNRLDIDKMFWVCRNYPACNAYVGTHGQGQWMNYPLGILANRELRQLKSNCHFLFDQRWKKNKVPRKEMYSWLRKVMKLDHEHAHIGEMTELQCRELIVHLNEMYKQLNTVK